MMKMMKNNLIIALLVCGFLYSTTTATFAQQLAEGTAPQKTAEELIREKAESSEKTTEKKEFYWSELFSSMADGASEGKKISDKVIDTVNSATGLDKIPLLTGVQKFNAGISSGTAGGIKGTYDYFANRNEEVIKFKDDASNQYISLIRDGDSYAYSQKDFRGCEFLPMKMAKMRKCFFCPLFKVIFKAADTMSAHAFARLAQPFRTLLVMGLGLYIAFATLSIISSLTKQDAPKYLGTLIKQSFKVLIAFLLLTYSGELYKYLINPLLEAGLNFGKSVLFYGVSGVDQMPSNLAYSPQILGGNVYQNLYEFIASLQISIGFMQAIGSSLMCVGSNVITSISGISNHFGGAFMMMIQGFIIFIFALLLSFAFAFYLIDAVVQIGVVGALLPFLILCWPFKITSKYTSTGFNMLMNSFFIFVFMSLVVSVNLTLVGEAITNSSNTLEAKTSLKAADCTPENPCGGLQAIYDAINLNDLEKIIELTDIGAVGLLILIVACVFGFKFAAKSAELAGSMASGGVSGIGSSIGTMAASAGISGAKAVTKPVRKAASDKIKDTASKGWDSVKSKTANVFSRSRNMSTGSSDENASPNEEQTSGNGGEINVGGVKGTTQNAQGNNGGNQVQQNNDTPNTSDAQHAPVETKSDSSGNTLNRYKDGTVTRTDKSGQTVKVPPVKTASVGGELYHDAMGNKLEKASYDKLLAEATTSANGLRQRSN